MSQIFPIRSRGAVVFCLALLITAVILCAGAAKPGIPEIPLPNLAKGKLVTASGFRGKGYEPEKAVDDNLRTYWFPQLPYVNAWWRVDLGAPMEIGGCEIRWDRDFDYRYVIEGSLDGEKWTSLYQPNGTEHRMQLQRLILSGARARFVRISIAKFEKGKDRGDWTAFSEFRLFSVADMKSLPAELLRTFPAYQNRALGKPAIASSANRPASNAVDGDLNSSYLPSDETMPQWWEVDLGGPTSFTDIWVHWEDEDGTAYRCVVEGSPDNVEWKVLADGRDNVTKRQIDHFPVTGSGIRYVRITVTGVDRPGRWACIREVRILDENAPLFPADSAVQNAAGTQPG